MLEDVLIYKVLFEKKKKIVGVIILVHREEGKTRLDGVSCNYKRDAQEETIYGRRCSNRIFFCAQCICFRSSVFGSLGLVV